MKSLRCGDAGFNCAAVIRAETSDEIMEQVAIHAREVHHLDEIDETTRSHIYTLIRDDDD